MKKSIKERMSIAADSMIVATCAANIAVTGIVAYGVIKGDKRAKKKFFKLLDRRASGLLNSISLRITV